MPEFREIALIVGGSVLQFSKEYKVEHLLTDSRKIITAGTSLFFAIGGTRHDGHKFIAEAYRAGVRQFIVEHELGTQLSEFSEANFIDVQSAVDALQRIASDHRHHYTLPVIGITGSNGKTIVKEWLAQLLAKDHYLVKSPKSFNSQIGVPLSVWEIKSYHDFGIFEAGISKPGEMEKLEKIIRPGLGIFTNIGPAHDEGFSDTRQKIEEKLKLFAHSETLFYCSDHEAVNQAIKKFLPQISLFSWSSKNKEASVYLKKLDLHFEEARLHLTFRQEKVILICPFRDEASIENLMHCITFLLYSGIEFSEIQRRISLLQPVAMRLELKEGIFGSHIIDDTYNNDLAGLSMALNFLEQQNLRTSKTLIVSDVLEAGKSNEEIYTSLASMVREKGLEKFIGIGSALYANADKFDHASFFRSTEEFLAQFIPRDFAQQTILIKGARIFQFEKIVRQLVQKVHGTVLQINLDALSHNLNFYRAQLRQGTKVMVMVKAFAYGSGSYEVANLLQFHRVDYLGVAYADEGVALRQHGIKLPIMVMNPSSESFEKIKEHDLEPEIYSFKILRELLDYMDHGGHSFKIHLKLDTGMKRLGFLPDETDLLISTLQKAKGLAVASIFTHLASAEDKSHSAFSKHQLNSFALSAALIEQSLGYTCLKHGLNTAGILRFPENQMDMVRLGIGLYGVETNKLRQNELQEVGTLKTVISQIKPVLAGETVGYNRRGVLSHNAEIAVIAIGYADGYNRKFGHGVGKVWVNGKICPTVGTICMDMTMVDVTGSGAKEGDEVIIFGKEISVSSMAASIDTIPYEILTGVNERVKRIFYAE